MPRSRWKHAFSGLAIAAMLWGSWPSVRAQEAHSETFATPQVAAAAPERLALWPVSARARQSDPLLEARVAAIVSRMTLEQKIGQMTQADIRSITPEDVRRHYIGSILNGGGAWPNMQRRASPADWAALSGAFYTASMSTDMATQVPIIWGTDAVHGHNNVFKTTLFPHNIALGAANDPDLLRRIATATAIESAGAAELEPFALERPADHRQDRGVVIDREDELGLFLGPRKSECLHDGTSSRTCILSPVRRGVILRSYNSISSLEIAALLWQRSVWTGEK